MNMELTPEETRWLLEVRKDLHRHPEAGFHETRTAVRIARELERLGLPVETGIGGTGVAAVLDTGRPGPVVMLRGDMDALPVAEETGAGFSSMIPGMMHACGHDVHMSWVLGAAALLTRHRESLSGRVLFLFQPAEESLGGAQEVIRSGLFERYTVDAAFSGHVWPLPTGQVRLIRGDALASSAHIEIVITGQDGHGARPHHAVNPIPGACTVVSSLMNLMAAHRNPQDEEVLSICSIRAGEKFNVIPASVTILGTARTFSGEKMKDLEERTGTLVQGVAGGFGLTSTCRFLNVYPPVHNDESLVQLAAGVLEKILGPGSLEITGKGVMVAEDFAWYGELFPTCYLLVGGGTGTGGLHTSTFCPEEPVIPAGARILAACAAARLGV